ncbi:MAG: chemotaxis protein [Devosia sp.]|uniref:hypothetical protein n=1 Tax=Devosia sp. TaxID=1871048 RepID=UPI00261C0D1A|nr:hypothetical protein [Devosia sp.]MDB5541524.1 chemotaxis protein [Devosia sp.]
MRVRSLSFKLAMLGGAALAAVLTVALSFLVQQAGSAMEAEARQLQAETAREVAAQVSTDLSRGEPTAEEIAARMAEVKPFGSGRVAIVSATGIVVAHPDPAMIGKSLGATDPASGIVGAALADNGASEADSMAADGVAVRQTAFPVSVGGSEGRWVVVSSVPLATLEAAADGGRWTIAILSASCVLAACVILFGLIRQLARGPVAISDQPAAGDVVSSDVGQIDEMVRAMFGEETEAQGDGIDEVDAGLRRAA